MFRLAFCSALLICGCASTAGSSHYDTLSASTRDASAASSDGRSHPSSKAAADGKHLERAWFVRAVLAQNPSIESARQSLRAALSRVRQSGSFDDPMVELQLAPLSLATKAPVGFEVMVSQQLPWFGKRSLDASVAAAEAEAMKSDLEGTRRELAMTAVMLYEQYFIAHRALSINAEHVKHMLSMRDAATLSFASGRGSAQDALQAEAELAHMEHDALLLASQRDIATAQMNELLHRSPDQPLPPPPESLPAPVTIDASAARLEADAVKARFDITAVKQRARAAGIRADRAERDYYPDVTVSTSYNSMWDMPEHRWMVGVGLNLPIFTGKRAGMVDEARAMQAELESEAARLTDAVRTQVFVAMKQVQESQHLLGLYETRLLPVARQRIDSARAGFITGQNMFGAVIEAEKSLRSLELEYEMAHAAYATRRAELDRALGRIPGLEGGEGRP